MRVLSLLYKLLRSPDVWIRNLFAKQEDHLGNRMTIVVCAGFILLNVANMITSPFLYQEGFELYFAVSLIFTVYCFVALREMDLGRDQRARNMTFVGTEIAYLAIIAGEPYITTSFTPLFAHVILIAVMLPILSLRGIIGVVIFNWFTLMAATYFNNPNALLEVGLSYGLLDAIITGFLLGYRWQNEWLRAKLLDALLHVQNIMQQMRKFVSELGHNVRAPLKESTSILRRLIEDVENGKPLNVDMLKQALEANSRVSSGLEEIIQAMLSAKPQLVLRVKRDLDLAALINAAISNHTLEAMEKDVSITYAGDDAISIATDPEKFIDMLINLLGNALRHTPQGGSVTILASQAGSRISLEVRDTGSGMTVSQLNNIRTLGYTSSTNADKSAAHGIGLASATDFVKRSGWQMTVESQIGKGSTFTLLIPTQQTG